MSKRGAYRALDKKHFKQHLLLTHLSNFKFHRNVPHDAFYQNYTNGFAPPDKRATSALDKKYLYEAFCPKPLIQYSKYFLRNVPYSALYHNCIILRFAPPNKGAAKALEKKYLQKTSLPEPLVQIQNNFTEMIS